MLETAPSPVYTMGYSQEFVQNLSRAAQQPSVNFLIPHLIPGQRLLDVGCGPGFLSARLADAIAPGEMAGIDFEPSQIAIAQEVAAQYGLENVTFQVADAMKLPFEDSSFDVVHLGGVLLHVPDIGGALAEAKRVLRPGGLVGCRDLMLESSFVHPELGAMRRSFEALADLIDADEGQPNVARDIKLHLNQAGFDNVRVSASIEIYNTPEELDFFYALVRQWFLDGGIAEAAIQYGAMTKDIVAVIANNLEEWRRDPGALAGIAFSQALAVRP